MDYHTLMWSHRLSRDSCDSLSIIENRESRTWSRIPSPKGFLHDSLSLNSHPIVLVSLPPPLLLCTYTVNQILVTLVTKPIFQPKYYPLAPFIPTGASHSVKCHLNNPGLDTKKILLLKKEGENWLLLKSFHLLSLPVRILYVNTCL